LIDLQIADKLTCYVARMSEWLGLALIDKRVTILVLFETHGISLLVYAIPSYRMMLLLLLLLLYYYYY